MVFECLDKLLLFHAVYLLKDLSSEFFDLLLVALNAVLDLIYANARCNTQKLIVRHSIDRSLCRGACALVRIGESINQLLCYVGYACEINVFYNACDFLDREIIDHCMDVIIGDLHAHIVNDLCL